MPSIVVVQDKIVLGLAEHNLIVMKDDSGSVIREFDGLATGANGVPKMIGYLPSDQLKVWEFGGAYLYDSNDRQATLYQGTQQQMDNVWNAGRMCMNDINAENLQYPFLGLGANSNSADSTLTACMGAQDPSIVGTALIQPGVGTMLLNSATIGAVQTAYGLSHVDTSGDSYVNGVSTTSISVYNPNDGTSGTASFGTDSMSNGFVTLTNYYNGGGVQYTQSNTINSSNYQVSSTFTGTGENATLSSGSSSSIYSAGDSFYMNGNSEVSSLYASSNQTYMYGDYDSTYNYMSSNASYAYGNYDYSYSYFYS